MSRVPVALVLLTACAGREPIPPAVEIDLDDPLQRSSYAVGVDIAEAMQRQDVALDLDSLFAGMRAAYLGGDVLLTEAEIDETLAAMQRRMAEEAQARWAAEAERNRTEGAAYLAAQRERDGVVATDSGLLYEVLERGAGDVHPTAADTVTVHYTGALIDGTVFDSSRERGEPATFPLDRVIPGWAEGLQLMAVGDRFRFHIPGDLAYGERGGGDRIGPNATLVFEVELLGIETASPPSPPGEEAAPDAPEE